VTAVNRAGGLVGSNVADDGGTASIDVAFANGNVTASGDDAGGLVGSNAAYGGDATIERAYATGQVGAFGDNAGGLVGQNRGSSGAAGIDQAYATGRVAAFGSHSGGLVGRNESSERNIFRAYWDSQSTGQAESAGGGVALTTAQMKLMASFDEWNISDQGGSDAVWRIYEGQTAPMLLSFMQAATVAAMEESVTREYNGTRVFDGIEHNHSGDSRVLGTLRYTASSKNVGSYSGEDLVVGGLYSSQLGYDISYASDAGLLVTPKKISQVTGITAQDRDYNGEHGVKLFTNAAQFEGRLGNDQLNVATASGAMDTKNAGDGKAVGITGITLGGDDKNNYELVRTTASTKVDIAKALIDQVTGITAENRSYNGQKDVNLLTNGAQFEGRLGNDQLTVATASGAMDTKNAGDGKAVGITGISLGGDDKNNYELVRTTASTKVDIAKALIDQVTGITAENRGYNGQKDVNLLTNGAQFEGRLGNDQLTVATASGAMDSKNAGDGKAVGITGITLGGDDKNNYELVRTTASTKVDIAKALIDQVTGITAENRSYNGQKDVNLLTNGAQFEGRLGNDQLTVGTASGAMDTKNAGDSKAVDITGITLGGTDAGNYTLVKTTAATKAHIDQRAIKAVITADDKTYDATMAAVTRGRLDALLGEDQVTLATNGIFATKDAGKDKTVNVSGSLAGTDAGNYRLEHNETAKADIAQRAINAVITADGKTYDATRAAVTHGQLGTLLGDDQVTLATNGIFATKDAGKDKTVDVSGSLAGRDAGNYRLEHNETAKADVAQRAINAVITADGKTYDATMGAATNGQLGALLGEDRVTLATSGIFATKDAGKDKTVNVSGSLAGTDAGNYRLEHNETAKADIAQRAINAVITADGKTYDATTWAVTHGQLGALLGEDQVTLATNGIFATKDAGTDKTVNVSGTLSGADAGNYRLEHNQTALADIAQRAINAVISADGKIYDATEAAVTHGQLAALLGQDQVTLSTSGSFATKDAGTDKTVNVSAALAGTDAGNYRLEHNQTAIANIEQRAINAVISADGKTYDATRAAVTHGQLGVLLGEDQVTLATNGIFATKDAGKDKTVNVSGSLAGRDAGNYRLEHNKTAKAEIAQRAINVVITADGKTYDATRAAVTHGQLGTLLGDDQVTLATNGIFATKDAGKDKTVNVSGSLAGRDAGNYRLAHNETAKADIAQRAINAVITADGKTYDATMAAVTHGQLGTLLGDDQVTLATSGIFATKDAGKDKNVNVSGSLAGRDAGNYRLEHNQTAKADIAQRAINAVISADGKIYDATEAAVTHGQLAALLGQDQVTLSTSGSFATKDAGKDKTVNVSGSLAGTDAGNYRLEHNQTAIANIEQRAINAVITADGKTYDATRAAVTHGQLGTLLGEDQVTLATNGIFATKDAGKDKTVNVSGSLAGTDAGNYRLEHNETAKADVAQRAINAVITADGKSYDATMGAVTHGQLGALLGEDRVTLATSGIFATKDAGKDKTVNVSGSLAGTDAGNYRLEHNQTAIANIEQRAINAVITADSKTYDATMGAVTHGQLGALLAEDQVTLATNGIFATKDAGTDKTVNVSGTLSGADAGNYRLEHNQTAKADIAQRAINAVITADGKTYDATTWAVTHGKLGALLGEDRVTLATSGIFATKDAGTDKTVNVSGTLSGADAGNYRLEHNQTAKADIAQRTINAVISADGKTYDATMGAVTHGQLGALLGEDRVTLATSGIFATKDAGKDKTVNVSGSLAGTDAGNYRLVHNATAQADIARLTIQGAITAENKTYDGLMGATTHGDLGNAVLGQDQVTLVTTGRFDSRNAGENKAVALTAELKGADAGNYLLVHNDSASADIDPRAINAVITANGKTYDATRTVMTQGQLGDRIGEDQLTLATSGSFVEKDAGTGKTVNVTGTLSGADAGNYRLVHNATAQADISQLVIHASIAADDKDYDGGIAATTRGALTGVLAGDSVALRTRGSFLDPAAGSAKLVRVGASLDGEDAGNYRLEHNASTWAAIRPEATVTAAVLTDVHAGAHPSRIEVARPEASASLSACLGDVYPLPAQVMNLGGLAVADAQQQRQPAIVFARVGGSVSDRACARTPF